MICRSSPAVVILGWPPRTFLTAVPVVWNAFQARNDTFVDSEICSYTGDGTPLLQLSDHFSTCEVVQRWIARDEQELLYKCRVGGYPLHLCLANGNGFVVLRLVTIDETLVNSEMDVMAQISIDAATVREIPCIIEHVRKSMLC
ncbi:hypothetical protein TNCV_2278191 [Trichonephila clavipes]|nr:hypothetical protein TNCV_2278191 [Trichonephila clavipes]